MASDFTISNFWKYLEEDSLTMEQVTKIMNEGEFGFHDGEGSSAAWSALDDLSEGIMENKWLTLTAEQRFSVLFAMIEKWPTYSTASSLPRFFNGNKDLDQSAKRKLWQGVILSLESTDLKLREAIEYVLWVDFWEDQSTCIEAWNGLWALKPKKQVQDLLIVNAGPVPYELKRPIYLELLKEKANHKVLAESLARSIDDVFGSVDIEDVKGLVPQLRVAKGNKFMKYLIENT
jgi:hypothetical protein